MPPTSDQNSPKKSFAGRTSLITALAIAGVALAGTAAIAANIGILNAADDSSIGELSATDELLPLPSNPADAVVEVAANDSGSPTVVSTVDGAIQEFTVDSAGSVLVGASGGSLVVDAVAAVDGWSWTSTQNGPAELTIAFTDGNRTVVFAAGLSSDGSIQAEVTEPVTVDGATPQYDDDDRYEDDDDRYEDDDDDDDDRYENEEYEGADDDD